MATRSILFVGKRNAARSLMAEAAFNAIGMTGWRAFSAGTRPSASPDRHALKALRKWGLPHDGLEPKPHSVFRLSGGPCVDLEIHFAHDQLIERGSLSILAWEISDPAQSGTLQAYHNSLDRICHEIGKLLFSGFLDQVQQGFFRRT
ncbi:MAG: hypothetical protein WBO55_12955 [Rhizobiaceae bacterium]